MESCIFHWGNLAGRNRAAKSSKAQTLVQATPWEQLDDHEEINYICCRSPHLSVFVLKNGRVYTLNSHHKRSRPELVSVLQEDKIHTVDSRGLNILYVSEAGNVYFSKLQNNKRRGTAKPFYITKPKLFSVLAEKCVVQVACGKSHSLALCKDGRVFAWGQNSQGQLGLGKFVESTQSPQCVTTLARIPLAHIAAGRVHTIVVSLSGAVFGWGGNCHGQLGLNDVKVRYQPARVQLLQFKRVIYVSCGAHHTAVLNKDGLVFTFGAGNYGQLGHSSTTNELEPRLLNVLCGIKVSQIACGSYHTLVYSAASRKLYSFGRGENGRLGSGEARDQFVPRLVSFSVEANPDGIHQPAVKRIFAGADQSFALCFALKASPAAEDQYAFIPLKRIVTAEDPFWKAWRTMENADLQENIKEQIICVFSSAERLNGIFLEISADDHFKRSRETPGIDLSAASLWFEKLGTNPTLLQEVIDTVIENLIPSLSKSPAGVEALRVCLILPELIEVQRGGKSSAKLTSLLSTAIVSLEESQLLILESWWSDLNEFFFNKLVNLYRSASHRLLLETSAMQTTFSGELHSCLSILQRLYKINSSRKPKYQEENFYISPAEVFGLKRISCKALLELIPYSCIFTMENKIDIFWKLSHLKIWNGKLIDESIIFNSTRNTETSTDLIATSSGNTETSTGIIDACAGNTEISTGTTDASAGNTETSTEVMEIPAENSAMSTGSIDVFDENIEMFNESDVNSEVERIPESYLPFKPNYTLRINREEILQSTLAQLRSYNTITFCDTLEVIFEGEPGIDQGGLSQEFFSLITKELYNQPMIFKQYEESRLLWFLEWDPEIKDVFRLLGILCWLALYNGFVADFHFPLALYKKLRHERPTLDDLKELSPTLGRNLQELLNYEGDDIEEVFGLNFTVRVEMPDGSIIERELVPNGKNITVQNQNRKLFVNEYVDYVFNTSVEKNFQAFSRGFHSVIPMPVVDLFLPSELMTLLHGTSEYDWIQLEENTTYNKGYTKTDEAIVNFWQMFHDLTLEDKKLFLAFLTGCDKVPVEGTNIVIGEDFRDDPDSYLPTAHTCSWLLVLPRYSSVEVLRERFLRAIRYCKSFGIA
ncbi:probable E3 ubiquitin-protein ligase HERC4 [Mobula birostris]|uniref:probable E3 ubiquitin-protein ligase HERC4 n=1 Tax=Mobula birostris TaxID=1983395 RepID=UPI003B284085